MTFDEWWDSLPDHLPHQTKEQMRMAWNAALKNAAPQEPSPARAGAVSPPATSPVAAALLGEAPDRTGWKLVPVDATLEMQAAGAECTVEPKDQHLLMSAWRIWKRMLAAAPTQPAYVDDSADARRYRWLRDNTDHAPVEIILDTSYFGVSQAPSAERIDKAIDEAMGRAISPERK